MFLFTTYTANSSVPQESVLRSFLFSTFMNDIVRNLTVPVLLYADDLKIYCTVEIAYFCKITLKSFVIGLIVIDSLFFHPHADQYQLIVIILWMFNC